MTLAVRASRHTWRRHSSVSTARAGFAAASPSPPMQAYRKFCALLFRRSLRCFWFAPLMSAQHTRGAQDLLAAQQCKGRVYHAFQSGPDESPAQPFCSMTHTCALYQL